MRPRLIIIYLLLVLLPLGLLAGLGFTLARGERQRLRQHVQELLTTQLHEVDAQLVRFMQSRERQLAELTRPPGLDSDALRARAREIPWVRQVFLIQPDGTLTYPSPRAELSDSERAFLERAREPFLRGDLFLRTSPLAPENQLGMALPSNAMPQVAAAPLGQIQRGVPQQPQSPDQQLVLAPRQDKFQIPPQQALNNLFAESLSHATAQPPAAGWFGWYWGSGLNLIYWNRHADGTCAGAELDRTRLLADLIGQLPDTDPSRSRALAGRIMLRDSNNNLLYQWGAYEPAARQEPAAALALSHPLGSWRLEYAVPAALLAGGGGGMIFSLLAGLSATGLALIGLAIYFFRESTREIREAGQRVSFVNQVSHELKTPLTNIRLYAELMQERLAEEDDTTLRHLRVIVAESERLSRLIGNVLTFSRSQRGVLTLHRTPARVGEIVRRVLDRFEPCLARKGIAVHCPEADGAGSPRLIAGDAVEQILGNLLSNVEKYAAAGGRVEIACRCADSLTVITVTDRGPGIPPAERQKIFSPFYRISSALTEGVSGAGIGLAIARELARRHGGDLTLAPSEAGACFEVRLHTPPAAEGDATCDM